MAVDKLKLDKVAKKLLCAKSVALFCHQNPDEDALGSCGALKLALEKLDKVVEIFCEDKVPKRLEYLGVTLCNDKSKLADYETFCLVDGCAAYRTGTFEKDFDNAKTRLCIDHHQIEEYTFDCAYQDPQSASASDIVFELIPMLDVPVDCKMATLLYAGIASDTGRFLFPSPKASDSLKHASMLVKYGADSDLINFNSFRKKRKDYPLFLKKFLKRTKAYLNGKIFLTIISQREYEKNKEMWEENDCPRVLDWVDGSEITIVALGKKKGYFHLNFRSVGGVDVGKLARVFGGGGHKNASGGEFFGRKAQMKNAIVTECEKLLTK